MPHRKSAIKTLRQNRKRNLRNKAVKSRLRTEQNKFARMVERGDVDEAAKQLSLLTKLLQRAAGKNVIHPNKAARQQALLQKRLNQARAGGG
jgi:small subunit ribosomal protein S20